MRPADDSENRLAAALADRYRIERELGAGGMATVYLAQDIRHGRQVAVKVLRPELAAVIGADRFLAEIRTTAALQHPHILPLFDSGAADSFLFYVMPFIEGETLRDRLHHEKQLPVAEALRIATEVAAALDYAHRRGVIHRDIKPENILLHDGSALVADFGIALAASRAGGTRMTETGMSLGTPQYMSPEQAMGEREINARSDIYALGAVTYEMLLGEPPFTGPTAQSIVAKVMTERPARLTQRRERIPLEVEGAVLTALEKLPADRYGTAAEFAAALRTPSTLSAQQEGHGFSAPTSASRARIDWRVAGIVGVLVGAGAAAAAFLIGRVEPERGVVTRDARSQITFNGRSDRAALSPDGSYVAFLTTQCARGTVNPCESTLLVQERGSDRPVPVLRDLLQASAPRFTSDGSSLVVAAQLDSIRQGLFMLPRLGGLPRPVGPAGPFDTHARGDSAIVASRSASGALGYIIDLERGTPADSIDLPETVDGIGWSPDGSLIAIVENYTKLTILRRDGSIADSVYGPFRPTVRWTPDGAAVLIFRALPVKEDDLVRIPISASGAIGTDTRVVVSAIQTLLSGDFDVARTSGHVALTTGNANFDFWTFELDERAGPARQQTSGTTWYSQAAISPDGRRLYYQRGDANGDNLYELSLPDAEQSLTAQRYPGAARVQVSPDGKQVVFANAVENGTRFGVMTLATRHVTYFDEGSSVTRDAGTFTREGIVFLRRDARGLDVRDTLGVSRRQLLLPDSLRVIAFTGDPTGGSAVMLVVVGETSALAVTPLSTWSPRWLHRFATFEIAGVLSWTRDGSIYFWRWPEGDQAPGVWGVPSSGGAPTRRRTLPAACNEPSVAVALDAPRGVCVSRDMRGDIWLLQVPGVMR